MKYFIIDKNNNILLQKHEDVYCIPTSIDNLPADELIFVMTQKVEEDAIAFGYEHLSSDFDLNGFEQMSLRESFNVLSHKDYMSACRASAWVYWESTTQYCSICGSKLVRHMDMGKKCPNCNVEHFPHLAPASIIRISRKSDPSLEEDDEILMVRALNFRRKQMYGLVAGFLEGGETLEECARREVKEEVGIEIKNIKYFSNQPWPYRSGVMVGFTAEYAGGEIWIDETELAEARWIKKSEICNIQIPDKMSIARKLIDDFLTR